MALHAPKNAITQKSTMKPGKSLKMTPVLIVEGITENVSAGWKKRPNSLFFVRVAGLREALPSLHA